MSARTVLVATLALFAVLFLGTVERSSAPWRGVEALGPIYGTHVVTQAFAPRGGVIDGFDVRLATYARHNAGVVTLHLRRQGEATDLRSASVPAAEVQDSAMHRFRFAPLTIEDDPRGRPATYELRLEGSAGDADNAVAVWATAPGAVLVFISPDQAEATGFAAYDGAARQEDVAFAPVYAERGLSVLLEGPGRLASGGAAPILAILAIMLPGTLLAKLFFSPTTPWTISLAAAPAFGLAVIALLSLWSTVVRLRLGWATTLTVSALAALGLLAIVLRSLWRRRAVGAPDEPVQRVPTLGAGVWAAGALGLGLAFRAVALNGLATPPGADSYHHVMITQLFMDDGAVPSDYLPYAPIESFAYHFGFHAVAAWVGGLVGWSGLEAVAFVGPLLNGLSGASLFALVALAGLGPIAATVAALIPATLSPFPAWFLDVGRYPQADALVIFPVAAAVVLGLVEDQSVKISVGESVVRHAGRDLARAIGGGSILAAGLFLSHYRVALMLGVLIAITIAFQAIRAGAVRSNELRSAVARSAGIVLVAGILVAPWIVRLLQGFTLGIRGSGGRYAADYYSLDRLGSALSHPALVPPGIVALVGVGLAVVGRSWLVGIFAVWALLLFAGSNAAWLPLPGAGTLDSVTVVSSLYVPVAIAIGYAAQRLWDRDAIRIQRWGRGIAVRPALAALLALGAGWGAMQIPALVRPEQVLARQGDLQAARWIAATTHPWSRFLVNASVMGWEPDFVEPTDGGAWLSLLARRRTTLLPLVYAGERGASPDEIHRMEQIAYAARADPTWPGTLELMRQSGVTHVYLGAQGGPLDEAKLAASPDFRRVYAAGGVSIYEFLQGRLRP